MLKSNGPRIENSETPAKTLFYTLKMLLTLKHFGIC